MSLRDEIRRRITNAYYDARNDGQTMETAADNAADAVLGILVDPDAGQRVQAVVDFLADGLSPRAKISLQEGAYWVRLDRPQARYLLDYASAQAGAVR